MASLIDKLPAPIRLPLRGSIPFGCIAAFLAIPTGIYFYFGLMSLVYGILAIVAYGILCAIGHEIEENNPPVKKGK
jgi:hypothetical protein